MKRLTALILILLFATTITACGGAYEAAESANATPLPTIPPTVVAPTPDTSADIQTDNGGGDTGDLAKETQVMADPGRGREIFFEGGADETYTTKFACATCHSLDGTVGGRDEAGPSLLGVADRAGQRVPDLSAEEYLRQSILEPSTFLAPTYRNGMTKIGAKYLSEEELDDVVAFLLTLDNDTILEADIRPTPEVEVDLGMAVAEGNATRGRLTAITNRCAACHMDEEFTGYAPFFSSSSDLPPIWERGEMRIADSSYAGQATTNQEYILESIFLPAAYLVPGEWPDRMPNTYHSQLSDEELADILAWLETIE